MSEISPINKLAQTPQKFEFFQAVRLLMQSAGNKICSVGFDADPKQEIVRFKVTAHLRFPYSEIAASYLSSNLENTLNELQINFLGLYGPSGILPKHYTELIIQRLQMKDTALRDFLDLFNHRIISLFYRSWEKNHFFVPYERAKKAKISDPFTQMIMALIGNGTQGLQERTLVPDESYLYYAGLWARQPRSACVLKAILADYFAVDIAIEQFQGKWLVIPIENCTRLIKLKNNVATYNQLGKNAVLGRRSWDIQGHFTIKIGPLAYPDFLQYLPGNGSKLAAMIAMARRYVGINLQFHIQLILQAQEVPPCLLGKQHLGWNIWLLSKPVLQNAGDTILKENSCLLSI